MCCCASCPRNEVITKNDIQKGKKKHEYINFHEKGERGGHHDIVNEGGKKKIISAWGCLDELECWIRHFQLGERGEIRGHP